MPKHDVAKKSLKDMRAHIEIMKSYLTTDRCKAWVRQDIRNILRGDLNNLRNKMEMFEQLFLEERDEQQRRPAEAGQQGDGDAGLCKPAQEESRKGEAG